MENTGVLGPRHLGVERFLPAVKECATRGGMCLHGDIRAFLPLAPSRTWDVVLLLDILEHLDKDDAYSVIVHAESIAIKRVIVFTPLGFVRQEPFDEWNLGSVNPFQRHLCGFKKEEFYDRGYKTNIVPNSSRQAGKFQAIFAVKEIEP